MQKLYKLANIAGLDGNNAQHTLAIGDTLTIDNIRQHFDEFIEFCRETKESITFVTKTERLDILANRFNKLKDNEKFEAQRDKANIFIKAILDKIRSARDFIKAHYYKLSEIRANGEPLFTDRELKALNGIGSTIRVMNLFETHQLADELEKFYKDDYLKSINPKNKIANKTVNLLSGVKNDNN